MILTIVPLVDRFMEISLLLFEGPTSNACSIGEEGTQERSQEIVQIHDEDALL